MPVPLDKRSIIDSDRLTSGEKRALFIGVTLPLVLGAVFAMWFFVWRDTWENDHRESIIALSTKARSLEQAGRDADAKNEYDSISATVGPHILRDPELAEKVRFARDASTRLAEHMASIREHEASQQWDERARLALVKKAAEEAKQFEVDNTARKIEAASNIGSESERRAEAIKRDADFDRLFNASRSPMKIDVKGSKLTVAYPFQKLYVAKSKFQFGNNPPIYVGGSFASYFEYNVDDESPVDLRFFKISGKPEMITFASDRPDVLKVSESGGIVALSPGKVIITVTLAGVITRIPILIEALPVDLPTTTDELVRVLGLPDKQKDVLFVWPDTGFVDGIFYNTTPAHDAIASHWRYNRYPDVVFVIQDSKLMDVTNSK